MANLTFTNSKISDAIVGDAQAFRAHITSAGVCETGTLAAEVAANLKDSAAYVGTIFKEATLVAQKHLQAGERVTLDGICRLEIQAEGSSVSEDEPWNPEKHRLVVKAIPYDALKGESVDLGGIRLKAQIVNTMPFEDSPFTPGVDQLEIVASIDTELKDTFTGIVPKKLSASEIANAEKTEVNLEAEGEHLKFLEGDEASYRVQADGTTYTGNATVVETEDDFLALKIDSGVSAAWEDAPLTLTLKSRGGRATDPVQTTTAECEIKA